MCDGMWIAQFLDHMAAILCKLAMIADTQENTQSAEEKKQESQKSDEDDDMDEDNGNKHIELA